MINKRIVLQMLTLSGLALVALMLIITVPALVRAAGPIITITKGPGNQVIASDSTASFDISVQNTGDITLTGVTVTDPNATNCNKSLGTLKPGESSGPYSCSRSNVTSGFTNEATASGTPEGGGAPVSDSDTAQVTVAGVDFQKTTDTPVVLMNSDVAFTLTLENTGDVDLINVSLLDPTCVPLTGPIGDTNLDNVLDTDEIWTYTCTVQGVTVGFTNVATATATAPATPDPDIQLEKTDNATVVVVAPGIDVQKTTDTPVVSSGSAVVFTITVQNTGDADLTDVIADDDTCDSLVGPSGDIGGDGVLGTGSESWTYTCTVNNLQESLVNWVTVTGTVSSSIDVTDSDGAQVLLNERVDLCPVDMATYWKLDEPAPSGPVYDDYYGGHDSNACPGGNCPISLTPGRVKDAQTFDGASTGINVPIPVGDALNWGKNDSFSIELWMKSDPGSCTGAGTPNNEVIIGRDDSNTDLHWWLGCRNTNGVALFNLRDINGQAPQPALEGTSPINDGNWHHLAAVRDGIGQMNYLYVDGGQVDSVSHNYSAGFGSASAALNIGWLNLGSGFHFEGTIDEVAVYNKVLSATVIAAHYNGGLGNAAPDYCEGLYPPTILSIPKTTAVIDKVYNYDVDAIGNPPPTYTLSTDPSAPGMTIDATGLISWTPAFTEQYNVVVTATNSEGYDTQEFPLGASSAPEFFLSYLPIIMK